MSSSDLLLTTKRMSNRRSNIGIPPTSKMTDIAAITNPKTIIASEVLERFGEIVEILSLIYWLVKSRTAMESTAIAITVEKVTACRQ